MTNDKSLGSGARKFAAYAARSPSKEVKQIQNFESEVADLIDQYLRDGMDPADVQNVLENHANSNLRARKAELV